MRMTNLAALHIRGRLKKSIFKSGLYVKLKMSHKPSKNRSHLISVPFYGWNRASLLSATKWHAMIRVTFLPLVEYFNQTKVITFIDPVLAVCDFEKIYWTPQCQAPTANYNSMGSGNQIFIPHSVKEPSRKKNYGLPQSSSANHRII